MFDIATRPTFSDWVRGLTRSERIEIRAAIRVLEMEGPHLGRPNVDTVNGSKHSNMKELRVQIAGRPVRIFFAFDPTRTGILLCGGYKDGPGAKNFYKKYIKVADKEYSDHLKGD
ncbi:TPA: type II toxin-antitoxin system RelE/ParE family toxin [Vibrio parahaemolyticus]|nr:type II toxin-antitoxin system RelE/ParE family toxin [Vibrio parahaemolyticus]